MNCERTARNITSKRMVLSRSECDGVRLSVFEATTALPSLALDNHLAARPQRGASASHSPGQSRRTAIYRDDQRSAAIRSHEARSGGDKNRPCVREAFLADVGSGIARRGPLSPPPLCSTTMWSSSLSLPLVDRTRKQILSEPWTVRACDRARSGSRANRTCSIYCDV